MIFILRGLKQLLRDTMAIPKAPMRQVLFNIYRIGPIWITVSVFFLAASLVPSRTADERLWIVYLAWPIVALAVIWHLSLIVTTTRPKWEMVLYAFLNLPYLYFVTFIYLEIIALGRRYWEAPM
jgi:hypothetical protein